jgi:hypothetical protein
MLLTRTQDIKFASVQQMKECIACHELRAKLAFKTEEL